MLLLFSAMTASAWPWCARSALFAVTTSLPRSRAASTASLATLKSPLRDRRAHWAARLAGGWFWQRPCRPCPNLQFQGGEVCSGSCVWLLSCRSIYLVLALLAQAALCNHAFVLATWIRVHFSNSPVLIHSRSGGECRSPSDHAGGLQCFACRLRRPLR